MEIKLPKNFDQSLFKKAQLVAKKIEDGCIRFRRTHGQGYLTCEIGRKERGVFHNNCLFVFGDHKKYEKFIAQPR